MFARLFDRLQDLDSSVERGFDGFPLRPDDPYHEGHQRLDAFLHTALRRRSTQGNGEYVYWEIVDDQVEQTKTEILDCSAGVQRQALHALMARLAYLKRVFPYGMVRTDEERRRQRSWYAHQNLLRRLLRCRLALADDDFVALLEAVTAFPTRSVSDLPLRPLLNQVKKHVDQEGLSDALATALDRFQSSLPKRLWDRRGSDYTITQRLDHLLGTIRVVEPGVAWTDAVLAELSEMEKDNRAAWQSLLKHALTASTSKPPRAWLTAAQKHLEAVGKKPFRDRMVRWCAVAEGSETVVQIPVQEDQLRGLIWMGSLVDDDATARAVYDLGVACFTRIADPFSRPLKVGNACVYTLSALPLPEALPYLFRFQRRVKDRRARNTIDRALAALAKRHGLSRDDLDECAVPTYGLHEGVLRQAFGDYTAVLAITGADRTAIRWLRPDGTIQPSVPAAVKRAHAEAVKALTKTAKDLRAVLAAQRDRLERLLRAERSWPLDAWRAHYLDHPLVSTLARRLIWQITTDGTATPAIWHDGRLVDVHDRPLDALPKSAEVRLWHPISADVETVRAWRHWLDEREVTQPMKQAHREIYLLTDAERQTHTYSNRFAAHILHQHQLAALCRARGWSYRLQGTFDSANSPTLPLPRWGLRAVFDACFDDPAIAEGTNVTEMGIFLYLSTDQVRFYALEDAYERTPLPLEEIPAPVFSEVMRDVDLFVSVGSIGNDPTWRDRGEAGRFADYWHAFSFGDLSVSAETRKAVLAQLLPRLTIGERCQLKGRFLVVRGDLRTYKIHLRSANILMAPNDQYLCIVPDGRALSKKKTDTLFLPFEGDRTLALILSKAFLLARDTAIKDPTIIRQISA